MANNSKVDPKTLAPAPKAPAPAPKAPAPAPKAPAPALPWYVWVVIGILILYIGSLLLNRTNGSVPVTNPAVTNPANTNPANTDTVSEETKLGFGEFGSYHAVLDSNRNQWTLGWWNENVVRPGTKNLADLKRDGGTISFTMPYDGWINNSAGELYVDGTQWSLGNYGEDMLEATLIKQGQLVEISYGPKNDSAGFQIWFK